MTQDLQQLESILAILSLKRQHLEAKLARLRQNDIQLIAEIAALRTPTDSEGEQAITRFDIATITQKWNEWRQQKTSKLEQRRDALSAEMAQHMKALQTLLVQIDAIEGQFKNMQLSVMRDRHNKASHQRLESWLAAHPAKF